MNELLTARHQTHGSFEDNARISQTLKATFRVAGSEELPPVMRESLDMFALKLSRILSSRAQERDHWDDIAGYAILVSKWLTDQSKPSA